MDNFLPFAMPDIGEEEIAEVLDSLHSGWLTTGPKVKRFEDDMAAFLGNNVETIAVNSATSGLHLALEATGVGPGDEVITTPYTFTATAEVIRYLGADPVFIDIDPATLNIDISKIEPAITGKTKAIVPVHFAGLACDMTGIMDIARRHNIKVVEDAAHALPATWNQRLVGTLGSDATVYSFYTTKTITTGEGGMVATFDPGIASRCRIMRLHGINRDVWDRYSAKKPNWYYEVVAPGYKYNLMDLSAAIGIHQLKKAQFFRLRRESIAKRYSQAFRDLPVLLPPESCQADIHSWHLYVLRLRLDCLRIGRDRFIELLAELGIGTSVHFIPLHLHPYWRDKYGFRPGDFPVSLETFRRCVSLPIFTKMTDADVHRVIDSVEALLVEHSI